MATLVLGTVATVILVLSITPQYQSSVKLLFSTPTTGTTDYAASLILPQRVASYADLARDPSLMQRVITRLSLNMTYEELQSKITAEVIPSTLTIEISAQADTPELAQQIADSESQQLVDFVTELEKPEDNNTQPSIIARVAGRANLSSSPVSPNLPLNILVGILLSLFVGIAGAVLRDLLDRTVKSRQDVEEIADSAVLATLPYEPQVKKQPLSNGGGGTLAEAFRVLRTNLEFANLDSNPKTILVSSAVPNEGKTLVATNLALSMAQAGRSVLLIDADMRNPNVADLLGLENSVGLVTVLVGRATLDEATQMHASGVAFLGTGPTPPNPAEVLNTQAMRDLFVLVRQEYDTVIIDAPPMLPVADASILMTEVDGALLLVRYGSTTREQLRLAVSRIETVGGRLFGTVLNRTPRRADDSYGYSYGYGVPEPDAPSRPPTLSRRAHHRAAP
ncbi:polysaccharide biosynthesis tyrosine autokinase [Aeromicrobium sp.]|uniref:polysaccharide biosynthesis tyrosine autokinase n=1 Tax=Aeromicrobium sp. TaxID=1871063 RepID=UPI00198CC12A|nr:polysaccharide biosynthesis tyrosine autokinase [Aeromicrobium sp.]MBC7632958.1 polysaccharide biosynthesis tyrosine autokinase [Aeromicrobium sp.]